MLINFNFFGKEAELTSLLMSVSHITLKMVFDNVEEKLFSDFENAREHKDDDKSWSEFLRGNQQKSEKIQAGDSTR